MQRRLPRDHAEALPPEARREQEIGLGVQRADVLPERRHLHVRAAVRVDADPAQVNSGPPPLHEPEPERQPARGSDPRQGEHDAEALGWFGVDEGDPEAAPADRRAHRRAVAGARHRRDDVCPRATAGRELLPGVRRRNDDLVGAFEGSGGGRQVGGWVLDDQPDPGGDQPIDERRLLAVGSRPEQGRVRPVGASSRSSSARSGPARSAKSLTGRPGCSGPSSTVVRCPAAVSARVSSRR